jgi:hypothetical protein
MANFTLTNYNVDKWLPDEFIRIDAFNDRQLQKIVLLVEWGGKYAKIDTLPVHQTGMYGDLNGASKTFLLPLTVDASKFPAYYNEKILPILLEMREYFVSGFVGADRIGYFDFEEPIEERGRKEFEYYIKIQQLLNECPRHSEHFYWGIAEAYPDPNDLFSKLESCGIDLTEISIHPVKTVPGIREILESDCTYLMDDEAFAYELMQIQQGVDYSVMSNSTRKSVKSKPRKIDRFFGEVGIF